MERLDDHELKELERLLAKGRDVEVPEWKPEFDERERGPSEAAGIISGRYIDDNCERWTHRAPGENEQTVLRTNFQMMRAILWRAIYGLRFIVATCKPKSSALLNLRWRFQTDTKLIANETAPTPKNSDDDFAPSIDSFKREMELQGRTDAVPRRFNRFDHNG